MNTVYLNGKYIPLAEAKISVFDRGFLFGDGIYEVVPVYRGKMFYLKEHLQRLHHSLNSIRLELDVDCGFWGNLFQGLLEHHPKQEALALYLQITRGVGASRNHLFPQNTKPTIFACILEYPTLTTEQRAAGVQAITMADNRWQRCDIKAITLLPNVLAKQAAFEATAQEAIFVKDGYAIEGAISNLFIVKNKQLITTPKSSQILAGITRGCVIDLAKSHQFPVLEQQITEAELRSADEIWLTGTTREITPVVKLDGKAVNAGKAGPVWFQFNEWFQERKFTQS